jgi:hypothetical protein
MFWHQFKIVTKHSCWMHQEKSTYLIDTLQGWATVVLHGVLKGATYEEILEALDDHFGDQYLAAMYCSQLQTRTHGVGESMQEFATAIEQLAYPTVPEDHIRMEVGKVFANGIEDTTIKIQLLLVGGEKTVNEALRQALELQAVLLATRPHKTSARTFHGSH